MPFDRAQALKNVRESAEAEVKFTQAERQRQREEFEAEKARVQEQAVDLARRELL